MNQTAAHLAETAIEMASAYQTLATPNPFHSLDGKAPWWVSTDPEDFYAVPKAAPRLSFYHRWHGPLRTRSRFTFPSIDRSPYPENNTVYGLASLAPEGKSRAALVVVHGHRMSNFTMLEWFAIPAARHGLDMYYITLPMHMQRAPKGTWSGQLHLNSNVEGTALAFRQGVRDVRSLISWIEQERGTPVGLVGMSLGAFTCSMTSVVDARPKALASILGGASLAQIIWDGYEMGRPRSQLIAGGVSRARLEQYWAILGPGYWKPRLRKDQIMLIEGKFDPIVTPENARKLWRAWDKPSIYWYPSGHGTIALYYREVVGAIVRFLKPHLFQSADF
ncbi:MAG TPA: alpha/beta hydrolase family protein [Anaerolineaceae bacterium]